MATANAPVVRVCHVGLRAAPAPTVYAAEWGLQDVQRHTVPRRHGLEHVRRVWVGLPSRLHELHEQLNTVNVRPPRANVGIAWRHYRTKQPNRLHSVSTTDGHRSLRSLLHQGMCVRMQRT